MKAQFVRLMPLLLLACSPLFIHCGGATNPTETATETGNPSAIAQQKLSIVASGTGVELRGEVGAVTPGATVTVTNQTTGERGQATAQGDGSVSVVVVGSLQDEYEVTVSNTAGGQTLHVFSETNGNVVESEAVSCESLTDKAGARANQAVIAASRTCRSDDECTLVSWSLECVSDCENRYDSVASLVADQINAEIREVEKAFCGEFESRNCFVLPPPCSRPPGPAAAPRAACVDGQCVIAGE